MNKSSSLDAQAIVIGLGAVGSAVLFQLAKRGVPVIGLDRFAPPHDLGSSHGETRITRRAVGEGADYVPFVSNSHRIWRELEEITGEPHHVRCGALVMAPGGAPTSHHGKPDFVGRSTATAKAFDIPHELLDATEIRRRFPHLTVDDSVKAYYEPEGGYVLPERCIATQLRLAAEAGAEVRTNQVVMAIRQEDGQVQVETEAGTLTADRVVVAAGAWAGDLVGAPFDKLLTVNRQVLHWFEVEDGADFGERAPVFIWMHGPTDVDYLYGFPPLPGDTRVKAATEQYEVSTTADGVDREVAPSESAAMHQTHVRGRVAGVSPRAVKAAACLYTVTPDLGFIIDQDPKRDRVTVVSACSGHGFKHSAGIGYAVAEKVATGHSSINLAPFSLSRFGAMPKSEHVSPQLKPRPTSGVPETQQVHFRR